MPWIPYWQGTLKGNAKYPWKKRWDGTRINDYRFRNKTFSRDSTADYTIKIAADLWQHKDYRQQMFKAIRKSPLNEKPGYVYSGLLFYLMPDIVTRMTGASDFETYLKEEIYQKIGAYSITYNPTRFYPLEQIIPTEQDTFFSLQQIHGRVHDEGAAMMGGVSCNAGLFATTTDLAKLMQLYLNKGKFGEEQIIAADAVDTFITCHYCPEGNFRGIGFDKPLIEFDPAVSSVSKEASPSSFGHSGYTGTFTWADPDNGILFVFMSNRVYPTRANRKLYELNIRPRIHQAIYDALK
jgi:CubicO group peptidase (beta-lactamase class C family)